MRWMDIDCSDKEFEENYEKDRSNFKKECVKQI
jgi:hypothetical protein